MRITPFFVVALLAANPAMAEWPQFRGPNSAGVATGTPPPVEFGPGKNELWQTPLGSGHGSPCIVGDAIFLATFDKNANRLAVVCIARADGAIRWRREVPVAEIEKGHPSFNPASSTPASDGERVVAYFGSFGLICFDIAGEKQWEVKMPFAKSYGGNAASPIVAGDRVILYRGTYVDHFLLAVDKRTGKQLWKVTQQERFTPDMAATATPIVAGDKLIVHSARAVQAFEIDSGKRIWQLNCSTTGTSTPVLAGDEVVVATWNQTGEPSQTPSLPTFEALIQDHDKNGDKLIGREELPRLMIFHRAEGAEAPENGAPLGFGSVDANRDGKIDAKEWRAADAAIASRRKTYVEHGLLAIKLDSQGTVGHDQFRRLAKDGIPEVPSPLFHESYIYFVKNGGILTCLELESGRQVYRTRTRGRGTHYASPVIAGGMLYTAAGDGRITVMAMRPKPKIVATNDMQDGVFATPAIVDGIIYVRTHSALFAFGKK